MQTAMRDYTDEVRRTQGLELRVRVGLNSGEVVVRTSGNDLHMDYSAVGQTTNSASRMEQLATPGSIRLSSSTLRLVGGDGTTLLSPDGLVPDLFWAWGRIGLLKAEHEQRPVVVVGSQ